MSRHTPRIKSIQHLRGRLDAAMDMNRAGKDITNELIQIAAMLESVEVRVVSPMLAALEAGVDKFGGENEDDEWECIQDARSAIAKARGEYDV